MNFYRLIQTIGLFIIGGIILYSFFALFPLWKQHQEVKNKFIQEENAFKHFMPQSDNGIKNLNLKLEDISSFNLYKKKNYISIANKETSLLLYYILQSSTNNYLSIVKLNTSSLESNHSNPFSSTASPTLPVPPIKGGTEIKLAGINVDMEVRGFYPNIQKFFSEIQKLSKMITINSFTMVEPKNNKNNKLNPININFQFTIYFLVGG